MKRLWIAVLLFAVILSGCAAKSNFVSEKDAYDGYSQGMPAENMAPAVAQQEAPRDALSGSGLTTAVIEESALPEAVRMIIQNATLTIVVKDPAVSMSTVTNMAAEMGGYVVNSNIYKTYSDSGIEVPEAYITVRVPAEKLTQALDTIRKLTDDPGKDVLVENISGQDVTKEYTDLNSRLKNLQDAETQLRSFMSDATKTEDVLSVYRELTSVTEQIEVIKGEMKYYEEASAMSAISVTIRAQEAVKPIVVAGWEPQGEARDAVRALIKFWQGFVDLVIWFIIFLLPTLLTIALPFFLIFLFVRWLVRRNKAKRTAAAAPDNK